RLFLGHEAGLDRQLLDGALDRGPGDVGVGVRQLEQDATGPDDGDPLLGVALARAHAGLGRLLRDGLVREDVDPDLATAPDVPGHGDAGGLDLARGDPPGLESLDAVLAEGDLGATLGLALHAAPVVLAVRDLARHQHVTRLPVGSAASRCGRAPGARSPPPRRAGARARDRPP